jgi:hypothetical protein
MAIGPMAMGVSATADLLTSTNKPPYFQQFAKQTPAGENQRVCVWIA